MNLLARIFKSKEDIEKIRKKLPYMFKLAELELSRGGHIGMEVGTLREKIIVAFLMYKFGADSVKEPPITHPEAGVMLEGHDLPISIKTKTGSSLGGVKLKWTVDWEKVEEFYKAYQPSTDMLLITVKWSAEGVFCYIPHSIQVDVMNKLGRARYIRKPKKKTNPRGVEISSEALKLCINLSKDMGYCIPIIWHLASA